MSAIVFDTHVFAKHVTAPGMPEVQARLLASVQQRLIGEIRVSEAKLKVEILKMLLLGASGLETIFRTFAVCGLSRLGIVLERTPRAVHLGQPHRHGGRSTHGCSVKV